MNIIFNKETYPEAAATGVVNTAMLLKSFLGEHTQAEVLPDFIQKLNVALYIPLQSFSEKILIGKKAKEYKLNTRLVCGEPDTHFINPEAQIDTYELFLEKASKVILETTLGKESDVTLTDVIKAITEPAGTFTKFFYSETECENKKTYSMAVINYYGTPEAVTFISTVYFSIT